MDTLIRSAASYREETSQAVKGYTVNLPGTIEEEHELILITDVHLTPADYSDENLLDPVIEATEQRTCRIVDRCYADGPYNQCLQNNQQAGYEHVEIILSRIQGAASRFKLTETEQWEGAMTRNRKTHWPVPVFRVVGQPGLDSVAGNRRAPGMRTQQTP